jgi:2-C-methyl-D-erythritol 4-phosphate cytidylyltransferase
MAESYCAVIVAAGAGARMQGRDKLFSVVAGRPLLAHTIAAFEKCQDIDGIALVMSEGHLEDGRRLVEEQGCGKVTAVCTGGMRRQDSVLCGLRSLGPCDWVAVHDGGRPMIRSAMITRAREAARETGAAVPVLPVPSTIKEIDETGAVVRTLDRSHLVAVQTPQVFRYDLLLRAHEEVTEDVTDDAAMVERLGVRVMTFEGWERNIKITIPEDIHLAEFYLAY